MKIYRLSQICYPILINNSYQCYCAMSCHVQNNVSYFAYSKNNNCYVIDQFGKTCVCAYFDKPICSPYADGFVIKN